MINLKIARKTNHLDSNITKEFWTMLPFYTYIFQKIFFIIHFYIIAVQFGNLFEKHFLKKNFQKKLGVKKSGTLVNHIEYLDI